MRVVINRARIRWIALSCPCIFFGLKRNITASALICLTTLLTVSKMVLIAPIGSWAGASSNQPSKNALNGFILSLHFLRIKAEHYRISFNLLNYFVDGLKNGIDSTNRVLNAKLRNRQLEAYQIHE
ncbi:hypothetical protein vBKpnAMK5_00295 [Klebsiella phage vB_Kpn_AM_K5]